MVNDIDNTNNDDIERGRTNTNVETPTAAISAINPTPPQTATTETVRSRSPYPTRSRSRRRQIQQQQQHQRQSDDERSALTADPLGLRAHVQQSGGSSSLLSSATAASSSTTTPSQTALPSPPTATATMSGIGVVSTVTRRRRYRQHQHHQHNMQGSSTLELFSTPISAATATGTDTTTAATPPQNNDTVPNASATAMMYHQPQHHYHRPTSTTTSDYMIGKSIVQAKISPMNAANGGGRRKSSGENNNNEQKNGSTSSSAKNSNRRRFFPSSTTRRSSSETQLNVEREKEENATHNDHNAVVADTTMNGNNTIVNNNIDSALTPTAGLSSSTPIDNRTMPTTKGDNNQFQNRAQNLNDNNAKKQDCILHGMNITKLRNLTLSCLGFGTAATTTSSPKMAIFFAGMVHSKTKSSMDAYIYAKALLLNDQPKRTVNWIERSKLLRCYHEDDENYYSDDIDNNSNSSSSSSSSMNRLAELKSLQVESLLLSAQAMVELHDWTGVLQLLEDVQYYTFPLSPIIDEVTANNTNVMDYDDIENNNTNNSQQNPNQRQQQQQQNRSQMSVTTTDDNNLQPPTTILQPPPPPTPPIPIYVDDDDDIAWHQLAESLRPRSNTTSNSCGTPNQIHPLSRICQLRARAYSELGHPLRANLYWNRALQIDPWCVLALDGLLETSVLSPMNVVETVLLAMPSSSSSNNTTTANNHNGNDENSNNSNISNRGTTKIDGTNTSKLNEEENKDGDDDAEWLRALYLARVCTAAPSTANTPSSSTNTTTDPSIADRDEEGVFHDDPMEDDDDDARVGNYNNNDDGDGDGGNSIMGRSKSMSLSSRPRTSSRTKIGINTKKDDNNDNDNNEDLDDSNDPSFWQDASSIKLLTPIPQQQSIADMSAASTSLFFPQSTTNNNSINNHNNQSSSMDDSNQSTIVANSSSKAANAVAVGSALDTLWNKFQLRHSPEVLAMAAQNAYRRYDWIAALKYCDELATIDSLSANTNRAAFCHVSTLVQLHRKRPLFRLAHDWVESSPKEARSWFAVGAYYYACERYHVAQRHFCRATRLDPHCVEAWIAFGASFAACDESDQALASFRAAQRLAPGNHTSLLYIGMEYLRTNHLVLAQHFLKAANDSSGGTDPLVKSETGVLKLHQKKFTQAIKWLLIALGADEGWVSSMSKLFMSSGMCSLNNRENSNKKRYLGALTRLVESVQDLYWESTLFNLAHAYRKERIYDAAVICLEQCLALKESASAHSALGYCLHLQSMDVTMNAQRSSQHLKKVDRDISNKLLHRSIDSYHRSLSKKPDDPFASEMLQKALSDALEQTDFFLNDDDILIDDASNDQSSAAMNMSSPHFLSSPTEATYDGNRNNNEGIADNTSEGRGVASRRHINRQTAARTPRESFGTHGSQDQSSLWTEDGLSLSVESNNDVDMT